jgi:site-specific DNA-methyltransferase (adenine-specific)
VTPEKNKLYYGDNYEVLQRYVKDETVDLVYLDPPFNSRQDYNVLFAEKDGTQSSSQIHAFEDTWEWNIDAQRSYEFIVEQGGRVADALRAFKTFLYNSDGTTYPRLQILTIQQRLDGRQPQYPLHRRDATFKKAPRSRPAAAENLTLPLT